MNLLRGWLSPRVGPKGHAPTVRAPQDADEATKVVTDIIRQLNGEPMEFE